VGTSRPVGLAEQPVRLSPRHVPRPRLTGVLEEADAQAIVLVAPAGYGKTTLAAEWLAGKNASWYVATAADADLAAFSTAVAEAASAIVPGAGERLRGRLAVRERPEAAARPLAELLAVDLAGWPRDAWLVLDDYHVVAESAAVEEFFDWLLTLAPIRALVTARRRPGWATARRVLYGEVAELGADELAMTVDEVAAVAGLGSGAAVAALVERAQGWPAVVGLAALSASTSAPRGRVADALYRYLADEVVRGQPDEVQEFMLAASVPTVLDVDVANVLGLQHPGAAIEVLRDDGLLHPTGTGRFRFHPLLREFLLRKLAAERPEERHRLYEHAIRHARSLSRWEEAFELALEAAREDDAAAVLSEIARDLLDRGRIETVERALAAVGPAADELPELVLARAEVDHRRGRFVEAAAAAAEIARAVPAEDPIRAASWHLAGRSYHLLSDDRRALECHLRAVDLARTDAFRAAALWGAIAAAAELDGTELNDLVAQLESLEQPDLETRLRLVSARVFRGTRNGTLAGIWREAEPLLDRCSSARDPMATTSFLGAGAYLNVARAEYRLAHDLANRALETCEAFRLGRMKSAFALCYRAAAETGLRRFGRAEQTIEQIGALGIEHTQALIAEHLILGTKVRLARRELESTLERVDGPAADVLPAVAEYAGLLAIAAAAAGDVRRARLEVARAQTGAPPIEARFYARCAEVIVRLRGRRDARRQRDAVVELVRSAAAAEILDAFVVAYRAAPDLLRLAAADASTRLIVRDLVRRSNDHALARHAGIAVRATEPRDVPSLTPREREVLGLMLEGLGNAEISRRLYISEKTTKVHVYHIFEKLGVESRVQAVIAAREFQLEPS
jgi:ATP/maltotriose-dependent transcriptional regulator MalT